jgi:ferredoxin
MKAIVNKETCIGCSLCADTCPEVFRMEDDEKAYAFAVPVSAYQEKCSKQAADDCPVNAISIE